VQRRKCTRAFTVILSPPDDVQALFRLKFIAAIDTAEGMV